MEVEVQLDSVKTLRSLFVIPCGLGSRSLEVSFCTEHIGRCKTQSVVFS